MITIFTCPKPFTDPHIAKIQRNAFRSWLQWSSVSEILVLGDEQMPADLLSDARIREIRGVERNETGTPLVNSIFEKAERYSNTEILAFINPDILILDDLGAAAAAIGKRKYLMIGTRWNLDVKQAIDFTDNAWPGHLWEETNRKGDVNTPYGVDYYVFSKGCFTEIPPFAIGRTAYDNWLIWAALAGGASLVDATKVIRDIHQNHDRTYASVGLKPIDKAVELNRSQESDLNRALATGKMFNLIDCRYELSSDGIKVFRDHRHVYQRVERMNILSPKISSVVSSWKLRYALSWLLPSL